jgi:hypothetical protein
MGRPRKRQFIETVRDDPEPDPIVNSLDLGPLPFAGDYDYNEGAQPYYTNQPILGFPEDTAKVAGEHNGGDIWRFGDSRLVGTNPISFDNFGFDDTFEPDQALEAPLLLAGNTDSSSSESENSPPKIPDPILKPAAVGSCSCLASMYLALASLQQLPSDVIGALRTVRTAAATAATTIWCPQCGSIIVEQKKPAIDGFQNTMLLGTLLPIVAHGYQNLRIPRVRRALYKSDNH